MDLTTSFGVDKTPSKPSIITDSNSVAQFMLILTRTIRGIQKSYRETIFFTPFAFLSNHLQNLLLNSC